MLPVHHLPLPHLVSPLNHTHMSSVFYSSYKILYPKRRSYSYSILGTIIPPNKILHKYPLYNPSFHFIFHFLFHLIIHYRALNPILGTIIPPNKILLTCPSCGDCNRKSARVERLAAACFLGKGLGLQANCICRADCIFTCVALPYTASIGLRAIIP